MALPGLELGSTLVGEMLGGRATQVFLKQFRDVADGAHACYQSVVEAPLEVTRVSFRPSAQDWAVTRAPAGQPPDRARAPAVRSQTASMSLDLELDFVVENGAEVGGSAAVPAVISRPVPVAGGPVDTAADRVVALVESAAGLVRRELSALSRLKFW